MRNVIVTGGSRGLGLAIVRALAAVGYRCIAVARGPSDELSEVMQSAGGTDTGTGIGSDSGTGPLAKTAGAVEFRACDLSELNQISPLVRAIRKEFGPIYGLVNNAGLGTGGLLVNMRNQDIQRLTLMNSTSPIMLTKYVLRSMMTQNEGRIVNIASIVAATGYTGLAVYSATKASLIGFTRSLAREVGQLGITVNALAPGFIATQMTQELSESTLERIARRSALKRLPDPIDVARSVEFLLGESGRNITGTTITIDAGNTA